MQTLDKLGIDSIEPRPTSEFALLLSNWLKDHNATKTAETQPQSSNITISNPSTDKPIDPDGQASQQPHHQQLPSWVFAPLTLSNSSTPIPPTSTADPSTSSDVSLLVPQLERLTTTDVTAAPGSELKSLLSKLRQHQQHSGPSASFKRSQAKYKQPWRRTRPESLPRKTTVKRASNASTSSDVTDVSKATEKRSSFYLPHDILLAIFSHLPSRAYAQQYYDRVQPSDLLSCSRVNMAWRIAALSTIWQAVILPDPIDRSCRSLLHLLASSHVSAQITGKNYDITEIIQRVEVDTLEAAELLAEERDFGPIEQSLPSSSNTDATAMTDNITTLLEYVSPFRTLSIQMPQEIESSAAQILAKDTSVPIFDALIHGIHGAKIKELDMPSPMYCSVSTFPGMLNLISNLNDLRILSGPAPVLTDKDLIPVIKACHELQNINISGQRLLGDAVLEAIADLWSLQILDIRDCSLMTGQSIKGVRWQSIQRVRMSGCDISQEFLDLILQAWRSTTLHASRYPTRSGLNHTTMRFNSVLDFIADAEDPVEMGWVRQREDEPPVALDEDHFFADWYV
ncbi:hypothetical protein BGX21_008356 [Mortierella sp. AD011]|nr:hypothetical protein BGX21_008356 [Mortierella sp. AD011]